MFEKPIIPDPNDFDMSEGGKFVPDGFKKRRKKIKPELSSEKALHVSPENNQAKSTESETGIPFRREEQPESRINSAL